MTKSFLPKITKYDITNEGDENTYIITLPMDDAVGIFTFDKDTEKPRAHLASKLQELVDKDERYIFMDYVKACERKAVLIQIINDIHDDDNQELTDNDLKDVRRKFKEEGVKENLTDEELKDKTFLKTVVKTVSINKVIVYNSEQGHPNQDEVNRLSKMYAQKEKEAGRDVDGIMLIGKKKK